MARGRPFKCPACGSTTNSAKGTRRVKDGLHKIRRCKNCGRKFTPRHQKPVARINPAPPNRRGHGNL